MTAAVAAMPLMAVSFLADICKAWRWQLRQRRWRRQLWLLLADFKCWQRLLRVHQSS